MPRLLKHSQLVTAALAFLLGVFLSSLLPPGAPLLQLSTQPLPLGDSVQSLFSPGVLPAILNEISSASNSLEIQLYQFSYPELKNALAEAALRGVRVRIILEPRVDSNLDTALFLKQNNVSVRWATRGYTNTHSKTMVADGKRVLVGSINWSRNAMKTNREAAVVIENQELAREFQKIFEEDWGKASEVIAA